MPPSFRERLLIPDHAVVADLFTPMGLIFRELLSRWGLAIPSLTTGSDRFIWCGHPSGSFSVASAWDSIRSKKPRDSWAPLIWDNAVAPRFQFILWLIVRNRLPTQVMLLSHGRIDFNVCVFCSEVPDSIDRLFFGCRTSASLAFFWATRCNLPWRNRCWNEVLPWAMKFLSGNDFYHRIAWFSFGALCHLIWKKRNAIIFKGESCVVAALKNHLLMVVRDKALTFKDVAPSPRNKRLQSGWGFDPVIFSSSPDPP